MDNKELGVLGESYAENFLKEKGYIIVGKNYKNFFGEIDLIAKKEDLIVFVEVKSRRSMKYGHAFEAVNYKKQNKIYNTSLSYIQDRNLRDIQFRYDIIEVYVFEKIEINHIIDAF